MENDKYIFRRKIDEDNDWIKTVASAQWGSTKIISNDKIHDILRLPGFVADQDGKLTGVILYAIENQQCEIVAIYSATEKKGVGTKLIDLVKGAAKENHCERVWLFTTNDNTQALRFYQKRGFILTALRPNIIEQQRRIKPTIPLIGNNGIPIRDEIELKFDLRKQ